MASIYTRVHSGMPSALGMDGYCHTYLSTAPPERSSTLNMLSVATLVVLRQYQNVHLLHYIDGMLVLTAPPPRGGSADNVPAHQEHSLLNCPKTLLHAQVGVTQLGTLLCVVHGGETNSYLVDVRADPTRQRV